MRAILISSAIRDLSEEKSGDYPCGLWISAWTKEECVIDFIIFGQLDITQT